MTTDDFDERSASVDILSDNFNRDQSETELCTELSSVEPLETLILLPITSSSSTLALLTSPLSTSGSSIIESKCDATCFTSDLSYVLQNQSDLKLSRDKRSCQLD